MQKRQNYLPYGHQYIDDEDIKEVVKVLKGDWITQGPKVAEFGKALADYTGAKYAVVFNSGTAALHAACFAAGIKEGDEVITTPISFVATSNCILYRETKPVFADIKEDTYNINPEEIKKKITPRTKAIILVDFAGQPADLEEIYQIAKEHNLIVIEDASHALGSEYRYHLPFTIHYSQIDKWIKVGSCTHSDMTTFSFHPVKNITTGEGGAVTTNNKEFYEKLLLFRNHGITKNPDKFLNKEFGLSHHSPFTIHHSHSWYYEMQELGYNYRLTDFQCALGISQLKKLNGFLRRAWHIYVIRLKLNKLKATRREIFETLRRENIGVQVHYIPIYYQPYYQRLGYKKGLCPVAERYYEEAITLPIFPKMEERDILRVINTVNKIVTRFREREQILV